MDCGPAVLKALLEGFGVRASYGRLREACQTDVDGTSIDSIEEVARLLGLDAEQVMVPADHVALPEASSLPALAVVRLSGGLSHFVVAWRRHGPLLQLMDPATGRRWPSLRRFRDELLVHSQEVSAEDWRRWAGSPEFGEPLTSRLRTLGLGARARALVEEARLDPDWRSLAALDAAARLAQRITARGRLARDAAAALVERLFERAAAEARSDHPEAVPAPYWSVRPAATPTALIFRGAVLVRIRGRLPQGAPSAEPLPRELAAALDDRQTAPARRLAQLVSPDGWLAPVGLVAVGAAAAIGVGLEALLLNGLLELVTQLATPEARAVGMAAVLIFVSILAGLELLGSSASRRLGRHLEARIRIAFLEKIPRLGDRYFAGRLLADMAERAHAAFLLHGLPQDVLRVVRSGVELVAIALAMAWLYPGAGPIALAGAALGLLLPLFFQPALAELGLRVRNLDGALSRLYLDALLGLTTVRAHTAEGVVRREHDALLRRWVESNVSLQRRATLAESASRLAGLACAAAVVFKLTEDGASAGGALLLVYWALRLPTLADEVAAGLQQVPFHRAQLVRLGEPLEAPDDQADGPQRPLPQGTGVAIDMAGVVVRAGGNTLLRDIDLHLEAGCHAAVVGPSGAGKSTLVGLLLGWHEAAEGTVQVEGTPVAEVIAALREATAWVDPAVQLWNRSLLENLRYGAAGSPAGARVAEAGLATLLETLPEGLQTSLGEGGALVSGGEGQRIRFGRALGRPASRLVILDEPFRGLDPGQRLELLARARRRWRGATILYVTHHLSETREFDRVLVMQSGRLLEAAPPGALLEREESRYRALLDAEARLGQAWSSVGWKTWAVDAGRLQTDSGPNGRG